MRNGHLCHVSWAQRPQDRQVARDARMRIGRHTARPRCLRTAAATGGHALRSGERCQCALSTSRQQLRGVAAGGGAVSQPRALIPQRGAPDSGYCRGTPRGTGQSPLNSAAALPPRTTGPNYGRSAAAGRGTTTASRTACMRAEQGVAPWRKKARELMSLGCAIAKNRFLDPSHSLAARRSQCAQVCARKSGG